MVDMSARQKKVLNIYRVKILNSYNVILYTQVHIHISHSYNILTHSLTAHTLTHTPHIYMYMYMYTHTHTYMYTHILTHTHSHTHVHVYPHTHIYSLSHTHTLTQLLLHAHDDRVHLGLGGIQLADSSLRLHQLSSEDPAHVVLPTLSGVLHRLLHFQLFSLNSYEEKGFDPYTGCLQWSPS